MSLEFVSLLRLVCLSMDDLVAFLSFTLSSALISRPARLLLARVVFLSPSFIVLSMELLFPTDVRLDKPRRIG